MRLNYIDNCDCMERLRSLPSDSVHAVITDIPYGVVNRASNGLRDLDRGAADIVTFDLQQLLAELIRIASGSIYIFCGTEQVSEIRGTLAAAKLSTRLCIWEKTNPSPVNGQHIWLSGIECCVYGKKKNATFNEHCKNTVFRYPTRPGKLHPTQKPVELMERLIQASTNPGDTVLDPFMGSGTTAVACIRTGRNFIGFELDEQYHAIAQRRIDDEINQLLEV